MILVERHTVSLQLMTQRCPFQLAASAHVCCLNARMPMPLVISPPGGACSLIALVPCRSSRLIVRAGVGAGVRLLSRLLGWQGSKESGINVDWLDDRTGRRRRVVRIPRDVVFARWLMAVTTAHVNACGLWTIFGDFLSFPIAFTYRFSLFRVLGHNGEFISGACHC
jgi:hypothetical protein